LEGLCKWGADLGYKGVQIPTWESSLINLETAAQSKTCCDELKGIIESYGLQITELSTHLRGPLVAVPPAYDIMFDNFAPENYKNNPKKRTEWAISQVKNAAKVNKNLGLNVHGTFSGALLWYTTHPWPQQPDGLVELGFKELAKRWLPILNTFDKNRVDVYYEIHPGKDLQVGVTFERFLEATGNHKRVNILYDPSHFVLQQLYYIQYLDHYHEIIKMFHVKDAEFNSTGKSGTFGGYQDWKDRAGRYRSLGDGQIDFKIIFSKLIQYGCDVWAVIPGENNAAPSDAIVLFDGKNLNEWITVKDSTTAKWTVNKDGSMTVNRGSGDIKTKIEFGSIQLHIEWKSPLVLEGDGQNRGNRGVFLQNRYKVQVLDNNDNETYSNWQVGSIYKQSIPLAKASQPTGEWNNYDFIFHTPEFDSDGIKKQVGTITVLHNRILVQDYFELNGTTEYIGWPKNSAHGNGSIILQDHNSNVSYRNIWLREL